MKTRFYNGRIVLRDRILDRGELLCEDGVIRSVGTAEAADEAVDLNGALLVPGFIDIHCHGGGGYDFMDGSCEEIRKIAKHHLNHGTTTLVATTMTDRPENIEAALTRLHELFDADDALTLHGVHMEGPWFSPEECGAQDPSIMSLPTPEAMEQWLMKFPRIERFSMAPELPGAMECGRYGKSRGVVIALGHTAADFDTALEAAKNGYTLATHLYSGMRGVIRVNAYRVAGAVEGCLFDDSMTVEIIADGKHLPISLLRYIYKLKGADRICLITDANRGSGGKEGDYVTVGSLANGTPAIINDGVAKVLDGTCFAGSVATTDRLFRNMAMYTEAPLTDVCRMASTTPARIMGYTDRGEIAPGKRADLVVLDQNYDVREVYLAGRPVKDKEETK